MTIPRDNTELDAKILKGIKEGNTQFWALVVYVKAARDKDIDHRLQAMRKNGLISFKHKGGWSINEVPNE